MEINLRTAYYDIISQSPLFRGIEAQDIMSLLDCLKHKECTYNKHEFITIEGHSFEGLGIILKGQVSVAKENAAGKRIMLTILEPGDMFGEMVAFANISVWPATVEALQSCTVLFLSSERIVGTCKTVCPRHTMVIRNMLQIISARALLLNKKVEYLSIKSMRGKISTYLLEQYQKSGKSIFMLPIKRNELAEFLNVSRPSMSREMCRMRDEKIIDFNMASIKIINLEALKKCLE
jgi:CRP-like cAMP-binding protein